VNFADPASLAASHGERTRCDWHDSQLVGESPALVSSNMK